MRLVIDLQGAQSTSRGRGIGRYTRALALAMANTAAEHQLVIALNGNFIEATEDLRDAFARFPAVQVQLWHGPGRQSAGKPEDRQRREVAEHIRAAFLRSLQPDLLLVSSMFEGVGDDAVTAFPAGFAPPPTAAICYDLIPLSQPSIYLPTVTMQDWYYRRLQQMKHFNALFCISQSSGNEAITQLGFTPANVTNILAGVEARFRPAGPGDEPPAALRARYGLQTGFILCVGAVEPRKNLAGLIRGYALLPEELRRQHRLVATGWNDPHQLPPLRALAAAAGLAEGELHLLTEFVPEHDLPGLYRASALTICPSLHEGFGLTVAEAMACGAPAVCSNTTSLPEVMDHPQALFDPADSASIAACLKDVLGARALQLELSRYGQARATRFSWENTATRAWAGAEQAAKLAGSVQAPMPGRRKLRLAAVIGRQTDPPALRDLLLGLAKWYEIILIGEVAAVTDPQWRAGFATSTALETLHPPAARILYLPPGDPGAAVKLLATLNAYPGILLEGGAKLSEILAGATGREADAVQALLLDLLGWQAVISLRQNKTTLAAHALEQALAARAIGRMFSPPPPAASVHKMIEQAYATSPMAAFDDCLAGLGQADLALPEAAQAVAASFPASASRTLFVDVSTIARFDAGTGIQRVVREVVRQLGYAPYSPARLELVEGKPGGLWLARDFGRRIYDMPAVDFCAAAASPAPGDIFLCLDLNMHDVGGLIGAIHFVRSRGARAIIVVYDLLPIQMPDCFPATVQSMYPFWLRSISELADGLVCISRAVADDLLAWLDRNQPPRCRALDIGWFHLGADFRAVASVQPARKVPALANAAERPTVLMVGTLEPRKGQADALSAMEKLWEKGMDVGLTLVGRVGWLMEGLKTRMIGHPEMGRRLNWMSDADDTMVAALYRGAGALLMASEGEGFGLPVVEAAQAGLPIIARDLPVFREVCGDSAIYYSGGKAALAGAIQRWLALRAENAVPDPQGVLTISWKDASRRLAEIVLEDDWYARWTPAPGDAG